MKVVESLYVFLEWQLCLVYSWSNLNLCTVKAILFFTVNMSFMYSKSICFTVRISSFSTSEYFCFLHSQGIFTIYNQTISIFCIVKKNIISCIINISLSAQSKYSYFLHSYNNLTYTQKTLFYDLRTYMLFCRIPLTETWSIQPFFSVASPAKVSTCLSTALKT